MRRRLRRLAVIATSSLLVAGTVAATGGEPAVVATDACGEVTDSSGDVVQPWQDLCSLSIGAAAAEGEPTRIEVRLTVASVDRQTPTGLSVRWDVNGCAVRLQYADASATNDEVSIIGLDCDDPDAAYDDCINETEVPGVAYVGPCRQGFDTVDVAPPTVDGTTYVWDLEITPELAGVVGDHAAGTELLVRTTTAGERTYRYGPWREAVLCSGAYCPGLGDRMPSEQTVVVAELECDDC